MEHGSTPVSEEPAGQLALDDMTMQFSREDLDEAYARGVSEGLRRADNAINWQTSCLGCADRLDGLYAERCRGHEEGLAEGRRQATEGWGREWGTVGDGWAYVARDEKAAHEVARYTREPCAAAPPVSSVRGSPSSSPTRSHLGPCDDVRPLVERLADGAR